MFDMNFVCRVSALLICLLAISRPLKSDELQMRTNIPAKEMNDYIDTLSQTKRIVTVLDVRLQNGDTVFDVTSTPNSDLKAWMIHINSNDAEHEELKKKYAADGFSLSVHRTITVNRRKLHSAVWIPDVSATAHLQLPDGPLPESGRTGQSLEPLNELMRKILRDNNLPGGTLAVAHHGRIIFERGFGYSDVDAKAPMPAAINMRIASLSKPITAVAILILVQEGQLQLDAPLLPLLAAHPTQRFDTQAAAKIDPAWGLVTVRHLLEHSGGFDRDKSEDTMFQLVKITQARKLKRLARIPDVIRYQLQQPLDFQPGAKYAYSNIGYCLLGRVVESVSGQDYAAFVNERILKPAGMKQTRLGKTRLKDRAPDETRYYTQKITKQPAVWDLVDESVKGDFEMVSTPYGAWDLEVMDSHGGWTSTAADLVRLISALEAPQSPLLKPATFQQMLQRPSYAADATDAAWYGLGWNVRAVNRKEGRNVWHTGSLAGTSTLMVRRSDGYSWAVLFNVDKSKNGQRCADLIDGEIHRAVDSAVR